MAVFKSLSALAFAALAAAAGQEAARATAVNSSSSSSSAAPVAAVVVPEQPMLRGSAWTSNETAWGSNETGAQGDETRVAAALEKRRGIEDAATSAHLESAFVEKYNNWRLCPQGGPQSQECHAFKKHMRKTRQKR